MLTDENVNVPGYLGVELPATFANQIHVSMAYGMARITFLEIIVGSPDMHPRVAMAMPEDRAVELAKVILKVFGQVSASDEKPNASGDLADGR